VAADHVTPIPICRCPDNACTRELALRLHRANSQGAWQVVLEWLRGKCPGSGVLR
jgi:hypothetical protein